MGNNGFYLLNGRSWEDSTANFTFKWRLGLSVLGLVWALVDGLAALNDLKVLPVLTMSDHLPVSLSLNFVYHAEYYKYSQGNTSTDVKLMFDNSKSINFAESIWWKDEIACVNGYVKFLYYNLLAVVFNTAKE